MRVVPELSESHVVIACFRPHKISLTGSEFNALFITSWDITKLMSLVPVVELGIQVLKVSKIKH